MRQAALQNNILQLNVLNITIAVISDWHIGSGACDIRLIKELLTYIKKNNLYVIVLGDLMDIITPHSKGMLTEQELTGSEQFKTVVELITPIKHKILFAVTGNHENRTVRDANIDIMDILCYHLGIEYAGVEKLFVIKLQDRLVKCYAHHGAGGGTTPAGKLNALLKLHWRCPDANIIFGGHTHDNVDPQKLIPYIDREGSIKNKIQQYISAGSALRSDVGYAAQGAYPPIPTCAKVVTLEYNKHTGIIRYTVIKIQ
jgi:predicted phosphodiesterase